MINSDAPRDLLASLTKTDDAEAREAIAKAEINETTVEDTWHRRDDIPPFWGGAGVSNGAGICSAGYAVRNAAGAVFSVTAGHCFANGTDALTESRARSYGIVSGRRLPTVTGHPMDMELMGGRTYAGRIYTGGVFSTTSRGVAAAGAAYEGYTNYCHSGRTTGENCGHTAQDTSAQVCTQTGCKSPVISFTGGNMIQPGDSGGTFFAIDAPAAPGSAATRSPPAAAPATPSPTRRSPRSTASASSPADPQTPRPAAALNWPPPGGIPERSKGTGCKPVGSAFAGSNPAPTTFDRPRSGGALVSARNGPTCSAKTLCAGRGSLTS